MPRRSRLLRFAPTLALALPAALALVAAACTSAGDDAPPTGDASEAPTPQDWMLSSGHVFGQGLIATRLPGGRPRQMGLSNETTVFDARWADPGKTAYAFVQHGTDQTEMQLLRVATTGAVTPVGDALQNVSSTSAPGGPLVAVVTFFQGQGGLLRAMDARNGKIRVLATDPRGLGGTVWAPDGSLLASLNSRGAWVFVDGEGHRATEVPVDNEVPFDWGT